jgi:hypothetical protein
VIIGDQHQGITSSIPEAFLDAQQQFCDWHAVNSMVTKMGRVGISSDLIKTTKDTNKQEIPGLRRKAWDYIKSRTEESLTDARETLKNNARAATERPDKKEEFPQYIDNEWVHKEKKVVHHYTRKYANLGSTASQRGESYHNTVREITNGQLSLEDAVKRLTQKSLSSLKDIDTDEASSYGAYSRLAQSSVFIDLRMKVSRRALEMVEKEWSAMSQLMVAGQDIVVDLNGCECEILLRFGIACRHHLRRAFLDNIPIPKTLLHPRWWLNGPDITSTNWRPFYPVDEPVMRPIEAAPVALQLSQIYSQLQTEERRRFGAQMSQVTANIERFQAEQAANLLRIGQGHLAMQALPPGHPGYAPSRAIVRRNAHGRADERALIGPEIMERQDRLRRQEELRQERLNQPLPQQSPQQQQGRQSPETQVPATPPHQTRMPIRTPTTAERPRERRPPSPDSPSPPLSPSTLPVSTAPPRLGLGRGKRQRRKTARYEAAQAQGFIQESQERFRRQGGQDSEDSE